MSSDASRYRYTADAAAAAIPEAPDRTWLAARLDEAMSSGEARYRYTLTRLFKRAGTTQPEPKMMLFVMLNPSTADDVKDDPTIRRCRAIAWREGCTGFEVVNLFAIRATDPRELAEWHASGVPIEGAPINRGQIILARDRADIVVAAWGTCSFGKLQFRLHRKSIIGAVQGCLIHTPRPVYCLGKTKDGSPRHPLYVRADQPLEIYWS